MFLFLQFGEFSKLRKIVKKIARLSHFLTLCSFTLSRFTLGHGFEHLLFDSGSFYPMSFNPMALMEPRSFDPMALEFRSFYPMSFNPIGNGP